MSCPPSSLDCSWSPTTPAQSTLLNCLWSPTTPAPSSSSSLTCPWSPTTPAPSSSSLLTCPWSLTTPAPSSSSLASDSSLLLVSITNAVSKLNLAAMAMRIQSKQEKPCNIATNVAADDVTVVLKSDWLVFG